MSTIAGSVSPQAKAGLASVITGSVGIWTVVVPSIIGMVAGLVGIILSIVLTKKALKHIKREDEKWVQEKNQSEEKHKIEMQLMRKELAGNERD